MTNNYKAEAEQAVIGGLLVTTDNEKISKVISMLSRDSFYHAAHGNIFAAISALVEKGLQPDLVTVDDQLSKMGLTNESGGFSYVAEIARMVPSAANVVNYAYTVKQAAHKRNLINLMTECLEVSQRSSEKPIKEQIDEIYAMIETFAQNNRVVRANELVSMKVILSDLINELEHRPADGVKGLTTGINSLDEAFGPKGMVRGGLYVVGARPKQGKSTFLTTIVEHNAVDCDLPCAIFSMEMTNNEIGEKMLCQTARLSSSVLYRDNGMSESEWALLAAGMGRIGTDNIMVSDRPAQTLRDIVTASRKMRRNHKEIGVIAVDYLTLMQAEKAERNDLAYGAITKGLKNLAKELNCPVLLLTQLNRNLENRPDKRPKPSDSRDTGQIEQDCDAWIGLYRDETYNPECETSRGFIEMGIEINRHAPAAKAIARFTEGRIENLLESDNYISKSDMEPTGKDFSGKGF